MRMYDLPPKESQSSHQQSRQKGRPELAISLQKVGSTPRKGRICPGHGGRGVFHTRHGVRTQVLVATRKADSRAVHGEPQEGHGARRHRQRRQVALSDIRSVRRAYLYRVSQGDAEAFWKGSGGSGQGLSTSCKICQEAATRKQEHQDRIPSKRIAVPQCGRDAGAGENKSCSSQNITRLSRTCAVQSPRIIEPRDLPWTYSSLPTEKRHCFARTYDRRYSVDCHGVTAMLLG